MDDEKITIEEFKAIMYARLDRLEALYKKALEEKTDVCQETSTEKL